MGDKVGCAKSAVAESSRPVEKAYCAVSCSLSLDPSRRFWPAPGPPTSLRASSTLFEFRGREITESGVQAFSYIIEPYIRSSSVTPKPSSAVPSPNRTHRDRPAASHRIGHRPINAPTVAAVFRKSAYVPRHANPGRFIFSPNRRTGTGPRPDSFAPATAASTAPLPGAAISSKM